MADQRRHGSSVDGAGAGGCGGGSGTPRHNAHGPVLRRHGAVTLCWDGHKVWSGVEVIWDGQICCRTCDAVARTALPSASGTPLQATACTGPVCPFSKHMMPTSLAAEVARRDARWCTHPEPIPALRTGGFQKWKNVKSADSNLTTAISQTHTVPSLAPTAKYDPSWLKATDVAGTGRSLALSVVKTLISLYFGTFYCR